MQLVVDKMTEADLLFLCVLLNEADIMESLHTTRWTYDELLRVYHDIWKNDADEQHFILHEGSAPVGWMKLNGLASCGKAWISMLVVSAKEQGKGIGHGAVNFAESFLRERGFHAIRIHTTQDNIVAASLYRSCGYILSGQEAYATGDGIQRMGYTFEKNL